MIIKQSGKTVSKLLTQNFLNTFCLKQSPVNSKSPQGKSNDYKVFHNQSLQKEVAQNILYV